MRHLQIATLLAVAIVTIIATAASAHDDTGRIEVISLSAIGAQRAQVEVIISFTGDGHLAPDATATAVAERSGSAPVGPIPLERRADPGRYGGTLALSTPGEWTVRVTSLSPTAVTERAVTVPASPPPTAATPSTAVTASTAASAVQTTITPSTAAEIVGASDDRGEDSTANTVFFFALMSAIAASAVTIVMRTRRRSRIS